MSEEARRLIEVEKDVHMLKHQMRELNPIPGEVIVIKERLAQLGELAAKIDSQNSAITTLSGLVISIQQQVKTYVAWITGGGAVFMFILVYGEKLVKLMGKVGS